MQPTLFAAQSSLHEGQREMTTERLLNMMPEASPGARLPLSLRSVPGLVNVVQLGTGRVRAAIADGDSIFACVGGEFVEWDGSTVTTRGTVPDGPTTMVRNGSQIAIAANNAYRLWDGTTLQSPTGGAFSLTGAVAYMDGYFIRSNAAGGEFDVTALADGTVLNALDFASAEYLPDDLRGVLVSNGVLWLLGADSVEPWQNVGDSDFPFLRLSSTAIEKGVLSNVAAVQQDNSFFWLSDEVRAYRQEGFAPVKVSTGAVDTSLTQNSIDNCFTYQWQGHDLVVARMKDRPAWVYDTATQSWHERGTQDGAWKATASVKQGSDWYIGTEDGWLCSLGGFQDQGDGLWREAISRNVTMGGSYFTVNRVDIRGAMGGGGSVMASQSNDGGRTFSKERIYSMGEVGEYDRRLQLRGLGRSEEFALKLRCTDNVDFAIHSAGIDIV